MPFLNSVRSSFSPVGRGRRFFNSASGGDQSGAFIVTSELLAADPNLVGVGTTWQWHWFISSGTLTVERAVDPFRFLLIGGGRAGSNSGSSAGGIGGTGGRVLSNNSTNFAVGSVTVSLGNGGSPSGGSGQASTLSQGASSWSSANGSHAGGQFQHYLMGGSSDYVSGNGGNGGGCANSFGVRAGCGDPGQQDAGGGQGGCGCATDPCFQCGGGCINCFNGHGALNGYGGGGGGGGACCGSGAGGGGRGGFIVAYRVG